jgi:ABC-type transport system substrate-binding protein
MVRMRDLSPVFVLLTLLMSAGCGRNVASPGQTATPINDTIRLPILATTSLETLDPIQSVELVQFNLDHQIFEGLVSIDHEGAIGPGLATTWEHSADYRRWRFRLRDARFADDPCFPGGRGRQVTAGDVVKSLQRGLDPAAGSKNSWALSRTVVGAAEFAAGKTRNVPGLRALDAGTLEIDLILGDREFLSSLTVLSTYVVAPESIDRYGSQIGEHPVGTGPFKLARWEKGQELVLERNPSYGQGSGQQPTAPSLAGARFAFFRSEAQVAAAFDRGDLDVRDVQGSDVARIKGDDPIAELQRLYPGVQVVNPGWILKVHLLAAAIGNDAAFGGAPESRRALSQLFPRARLEHGVLRGLGKSFDTVLAPRLGGLRIAPDPLPDPISTLRQALHGGTVRIAYVSSRIDDATVTLLRGILEGAGAKIVVFPNTSVNALFSSLPSTRPDLTLLYWSPFFPNLPEYLQALLKSGQPVPNFTLFADDRLDRAVAELRRPGGRTTEQLLPEINRVLNETMPWIPLYYETPLVLAAPRVQGYAINPVSTIQLTAVRLKPR